MDENDSRRKLSPQQARDLVAGTLGRPAEGLTGPADIEIPGFEVIHQIGKGGMGEVYFATEMASGAEVAIKVLSLGDGCDPLGNERFLREGEVLDRLNHPNLLKIRQRGAMQDGRPFLVTDYAEGGTLQDLIKTGKEFDDQQIRKLMCDLCSGLAEVHRAGLIHRDIKPSNLLLHKDGRLIVADFGLAKELQLDLTELTLSGTTLGTANYMAPEQGTPDAPTDARADVFSIGVVLYQLLTGELPKGQFPPPSKSGNDKSWDQIISRCLSTSPEGRYKDANELYRALTKDGSVKSSRRTFIYTGIGVGILSGAVIASKHLTGSTDQEEWNNLLTEFPLSSPWVRTEAGAIKCPATNGAAEIFTSVDPGDTYELKFKWVRLSGEASLALFFPTREGAATFEMGAWLNDYNGIQAVSRRTLRDPGSGSIEVGFASGIIYSINLKVTPDVVSFKIDNHPAQEIPIAGREVRRTPHWTRNFANSIGFGAWQSEIEISQLELKSTAKSDQL